MTIARIVRASCVPWHLPASDLLRRGQVRSFTDAMDLLIRACREEADQVRSTPRDSVPETLDAELLQMLSLLEYAACACRFVYLCGFVPASALARIWEGATSDNVRLIGRCLRTGDYRPLAI